MEVLTGELIEDTVKDQVEGCKTTVAEELRRTLEEELNSRAESVLDSLI
jgi:hypothetical protein